MNADDRGANSQGISALRNPHPTCALPSSISLTAPCSFSCSPGGAHGSLCPVPWLNPSCVSLGYVSNSVVNVLVYVFVTVQIPRLSTLFRGSRLLFKCHGCRSCSYLGCSSNAMVLARISILTAVQMPWSSLSFRCQQTLLFVPWLKLCFYCA